MKILIANGLIVFSLLCMVIYGIRRNNNFVNIFYIIKDHFSIFDGAMQHIVILYVFPIITAVGIAIMYDFSDSMIEAIMVVISVVISALLSFQGGILNLDRNMLTPKKVEILNQTNYSINFTVLINIVLVFVMLIYIAIDNFIFRRIVTGIIAYILMITFLTILIIVKRVRVLMIQS